VILHAVTKIHKLTLKAVETIFHLTHVMFLTGGGRPDVCRQTGQCVEKVGLFWPRVTVGHRNCWNCIDGRTNCRISKCNRRLGRMRPLSYWYFRACVMGRRRRGKGRWNRWLDLSGCWRLTVTWESTGSRTDALRNHGRE
jgi:hypothetical protein